MIPHLCYTKTKHRVLYDLVLSDDLPGSKSIIGEVFCISIPILGYFLVGYPL